MFTLFLFALSYSLTSTHSVKSTSTFDHLPSFGFDEGGKFKIRISSTKRFNTTVFFIRQEKFQTIDLSKTSQNAYCLNEKNMELYFSTRYFHIFNNRYSSEWTGIINSSSIYIPLIANCYNSPLTVSYTFQNRETFLDSREKYMPILFTLCSYLSLFISFIWLVNSLMYPKFFVFLNALLAIATFFLSVTFYFQGHIWLLRSQRDYSSPSMELLTFLIDGYSLAFFFTLNACAAYGYGIYIEDHKVLITRCCELLFACYSIYLTIYIMTSVKFYIAVILYVLIVVIFAPFLDFVMIGLHHSINLQLQFHEDPHAFMKFELAINFANDLSTYLLVLLFTSMLMLINSYHRAVFILVKQFFTFLLLFLDLHHFLYRDSYNGDAQEVDEEAPINGVLTQIQDPCKTDFVFITE